MRSPLCRSTSPGGTWTIREWVSLMQTKRVHSGEGTGGGLVLSYSRWTMAEGERRETVGGASAAPGREDWESIGSGREEWKCFRRSQMDGGAMARTEEGKVGCASGWDASANARTSVDNYLTSQGVLAGRGGLRGRAAAKEAGCWPCRAWPGLFHGQGEGRR